MYKNEKACYLTEIIAISRYEMPENVTLKIENPDIPIEVKLENYYEKIKGSNKKKHYLKCLIKTQSIDFEDARNQAVQHLSNLLNYLSLLSNQKSYILRPVRTIYWGTVDKLRSVRTWFPFRTLGRMTLNFCKNIPEELQKRISDGFNKYEIQDTYTKPEDKEKREKYLTLLAVYNTILYIDDDYIKNANILRAFEIYASMQNSIEKRTPRKCEKCKQDLICKQCDTLSIRDSIPSIIRNIFSERWNDNQSKSMWNCLQSIKHGSRSINFDKLVDININTISDLNNALQNLLRRKILEFIGMNGLPDYPDTTKNIAILNIQYDYDSGNDNDYINPSIQNIPKLDLILVHQDHPELKANLDINNIQDINLFEILARFT